LTGKGKNDILVEGKNTSTRRPRMSHIHVSAKGYAEIYKPQRKNGKKVNAPEYLGKIINLEEGIFHSKKRGYFRYTIEKGYEESEYKRTNEERMILDFGAAYVLNEVMKKEGYENLFSEIMEGKADSLMALVYYRILEKGGYYLAEDWLSGSYASILYPKARLQSQRVSELLGELGEEAVVRAFFEKYLKKVIPPGRKTGILIDSTGLPNDIDFYLTAVNNHGGEINNESRLILVVDKITKKPLFFRYNAGNVPDVSTLIATRDELRIMNVDIGMIIMDAGYPSDGAIDDLFSEKIPFLSRLKPNRKLYKSLTKTYGEEVLDDSSIVRYPGRLVGIVRKEVKLTDKNNGFVYIAVDHDRRHSEWTRFTMEALEDGLTIDERREKTATLGFFVLVSSECIDVNDVLQLYYSRQAIEQIFDIDKNDLNLLPLRVHSEETFRGHLMLVFLASIVHLLLVDKLRDSKFNVDQAFSIFRNLKCKVFSNAILVKEPVKKMNLIAKFLDLYFPSVIVEGKFNGN
jgi:hypothetical protein